MKKMFLFAAFAGIALASCTTDEEIFAPVNQGNEIEFVAADYVHQTRGGHGETALESGSFGVYAWEYGTDDALMSNVEIAKNGNTWKPTTGKYYWPDNTFVDFTAVYPFGNSAFTEVERVVTEDEGELTSTADITVEFNETYPNPTNVNLMYADLVKQKYTYPTDATAASAPAVPMLFRHLLAKLNVVVDQTDIECEGGVASYKITLNKVAFTGLYNQGSLTVDATYREAAKGDNANTIWEGQDGEATWNVFTGTQDLSGDSKYKSTATYYVMPQNIDGTQKLVIEYTITTTFTNGTVATSPKTRTIALNDIETSVENWYTNKSITYTVNISPAALAEITFSATEENWCEDEENNGEENID